MRTLPILPILCAACAIAPAQQVGQNKVAGTDQGYTLKVQSQLVIEAVTVKDKQGHFIPGLTAKDFVVTEAHINDNPNAKSAGEKLDEMKKNSLTG